MSLTLILVVTAAVAGSMGYLAARKKEDEPEPSPKKRKDDKDDNDHDHDHDRDHDEEEKDEYGKPPPPVKPLPRAKVEASRKPAAKVETAEEKAKKTFAGLPLSLGDVVSDGHEERWLAGALVAREQGRVLSALFLAPEGAKLSAVAVFAAPRKDIYWMDPAELDVTDEPPATIELGGVAFRRKARLPVTLERLGQGAPSIGEEAIWGVYDGGPSEVAVVLVSEGRVHAWQGRRLDEDRYDRLGEG
jgi:Ni/Co efflux regulator RcnB